MVRKTTNQTAQPSLHQMALLAHTLWEVGLISDPKTEEIEEWCQELIENEIELEDCTMYTYFYWGEGMRKGGVNFIVKSQEQWEFAVKLLKTMVRDGELNLNGVTVTIKRYDRYATETIKFTGNNKVDISKLNKLKAIKPDSIWVDSNGEVIIYVRTE